MQTFLRGLIAIDQMALILSQSVKLIRKFTSSHSERNTIWKPIDEGYDDLLKSFKKIKEDLKEVHV